MEQLVLIAHILIALGIIGLILLQQGKGAEAGASFGSGASQTVFGSGGSGNFLTRATAILAVLFFLTSFALAVFAKNNAAISDDLGILETSAPIAEESDIPFDVEESGEIPAESDISTDAAISDEVPVE